MILKIALWIVLGFVLLRIWREILELIWSSIEAHEDGKREKRNEEIEEKKRKQKEELEEREDEVLIPSKIKWRDTLIRLMKYDRSLDDLKPEQMKEWKNLLKSDFQYWFDTLVNLKYQLEKNQKIIDFMVKHHINPYKCKDPDIETMTKYFVYIPEKHKK